MKTKFMRLFGFRKNKAESSPKGNITHQEIQEFGAAINGVTQQMAESTQRQNQIVKTIDILARSVQKNVIQSSNNHANQIDFTLENVRQLVSEVNKSISDVGAYRLHKCISLLLEQNRFMKARMRTMEKKIDALHKQKVLESKTTKEPTTRKQTTKTSQKICKFCGEKLKGKGNARKFCSQRNGTQNYCYTHYHLQKK